MSRHHVAQLGLAAAVGLSALGLLESCAAPLPPPETAQRGLEADEDDLVGRKKQPVTVADWEARIDLHAGALTRLTAPLRTRDAATVAPGVHPGPTPASPGPSAVAPRRAPLPATGRVRRPNRAHSERPVKATDQRTIRCQRICRHVRAICHAASRICQIANRLSDPPAEQACRRGRHRCADARTVARRHCAPCGLSRRPPGRGWFFRYALQTLAPYHLACAP